MVSCVLEYTEQVLPMSPPPDPHPHQAHIISLALGQTWVQESFIAAIKS